MYTTYQPGTYPCVRYVGASTDQIRYRNTDDPRGLLRIGEAYWIEAEDIGDWFTYVRLLGVPGKTFNSVHFTRVSPA